MTHSLRSFLLATILFTIVGIGGITVWGGYRASVHEVKELFDAQLSRSARLMLGLVQAEVNLGHMKEFTDNLQQGENRVLPDKKLLEQELYQQGHFYELKLAYQVWDSYGNMLIRSANAPLQPISNMHDGYADQQFNQKSWRTYTMWDATLKYQVITAEREDVRNDLVNKIIFQMTWPFVLLVPVLGILVWFFVGRGLKPLEHIASEIASRKSLSLKPLKFDRVPVEIQPLIDELNSLFNSLQQAFEMERRFTSDAAHELRTPLAALKVHLQLLDSSEGEQEKNRALVAVRQGVERAAHLVEQLLGLARLDPQAIRAMQKIETVDLHRLCVDLLADIYPLASEKHQEISLLGDTDVTLEGYAYPLESMLQNLLSNSVKYAPQGGEICLELKQSAHSLDIWVHDSGPGIPEEQRQDVLQRFKKVQGNTHAGSGIGLSIVSRVAELHHMQLRLLTSEKLGGLCVHLQRFD
ncbi:Sensory histidine kinase QseC [hydrothermal vent metagenome]|uniref:histidine kinase n=1 Tax=hydrothermal vent metagenome TaxID=652676 RepID=A0A3B0Y0M5_9ZZZZ